MDLFGGYLLVLLALFAGNISLLLGNYKLDNTKVIGISLIFAIATFLLMSASNSLNGQLSFLLDYFSYLFFVVFIVMLAVILYYSKTGNFKTSLLLVMLMFFMTLITLSSQSEFGLFDMILYSLFVFIIIFMVYKLSNLLHHAKRQYSVIIGEYMSLFSILIFIFALTYDSTRTLDYTMFSPFLILTPTYQLIYVIIAIIVVLVIGVLINDQIGGK